MKKADDQLLDTDLKSVVTMKKKKRRNRTQMISSLTMMVDQLQRKRNVRAESSTTLIYKKVKTFSALTSITTNSKSTMTKTTKMNRKARMSTRKTMWMAKRRDVARNRQKRKRPKSQFSKSMNRAN